MRCSDEGSEELSHTKLKVAQRIAARITQKKIASSLVNLGSTPTDEDFEADDMVKEYERSLALDFQNGTPFMREALKKAHGLTCRFAFAAHLWNEAETSSCPTTITADKMNLGMSLSKDSFEHFRFTIDPTCLRARIHARKLLDSLLCIDFNMQHEVLRHGISSRTLQQRTGLKADEVRKCPGSTPAV